MARTYFTLHVIVTLRILINLCTSLNWSWRIDDAFDGKVYFVDVGSRNHSVGSQNECAKVCLEWKHCSSFYYNCKTGWCSIQVTVYEATKTTKLAVASLGTRYFRLHSDICPMNSGYYIYRPLEMCLKLFFQDITSYDEASIVCSKNHGKLISLETREKYDAFIYILFNQPEIRRERFNRAKNILVGAKKLNGIFKWVNGYQLSPNAYRWAPDEPTNGSQENCLGIGVFSEELFDNPCTGLKPYFMAFACDFETH